MRLLRPLRELRRQAKLYEPGPAELFDIRIELERAVPVPPFGDARNHLWHKGTIHRRGESEAYGFRSSGPVLWYGTHWMPALTLCNAFARVAAFAECDRVRFTILKHRKNDAAAYVTYQFSDHGTMRRIVSVQQPGATQPQVTISDHNYFAPHEVV